MLAEISGDGIECIPDLFLLHTLVLQNCVLLFTSHHEIEVAEWISKVIFRVLERKNDW